MALAGTVVNTINEVESLGQQLKQGGVQLWNKAKRNTILQVYGNTPYSGIAAQYVGAVNTLKEEFANLAQGGYAPTEAAWELANEQINGDFGAQDLSAALAEVQRLINYRRAAFEELTPSMIPWGGGMQGEGERGTRYSTPQTMIKPDGSSVTVHQDDVEKALAKGWTIR